MGRKLTVTARGFARWLWYRDRGRHVAARAKHGKRNGGGQCVVRGDDCGPSLRRAVCRPWSLRRRRGRDRCTGRHDRGASRYLSARCMTRKRGCSGLKRECCQSVLQRLRRRITDLGHRRRELTRVKGVLRRHRLARPIEQSRERRGGRCGSDGRCQRGGNGSDGRGAGSRGCSLDHAGPVLTGSSPAIQFPCQSGACRPARVAAPWRQPRALAPPHGPRWRHGGVRPRSTAVVWRRRWSGRAPLRRRWCG